MFEKKKPLFEIGYNKNVELDFGIKATVGGLSLEELNKFRSMIIVAIGISEDMWRRANNTQAYTDKDFSNVSTFVYTV